MGVQPGFRAVNFSKHSARIDTYGCKHLGTKGLRVVPAGAINDPAQQKSCSELP